MKNKKNKKAVTVVSVILIVLILIAVAVISVHKYREATINKNIQKINISWSEFYSTNENDLSKFPAYTVNDCDVFCKYKINDNGTGDTVVRTDLKISDYVPYTIKYTLKNDSDYNIESTHICGQYSSDVVITEVNTDWGYWYGPSVSSHSQQTFESLVWVKKDLTQSQVDEIFKTLEFDCDISVDCISGNELDPKTVTLKCSHICK